jgi:hypothetical protein
MRAALVAVVTLAALVSAAGADVWLVAERDRLRAGGEFDEAAARRFLDERR